MKFLPIFLSLSLASVALAEDPAELSERRQAWEKERTEAQANVDKLYFEELEELKKNFTRPFLFRHGGSGEEVDLQRLI